RQTSVHARLGDLQAEAIRAYRWGWWAGIPAGARSSAASLLHKDGNPGKVRWGKLASRRALLRGLTAGRAGNGRSPGTVWFRCRRRFRWRPTLPGWRVRRAV